MQVLPPPLTKPIVPYMEVVHDRAAIEIQRGCTQGCRFCQAGMIYRPTRERSVEEVVTAAGELLDNTGYHELSLMSLSTTDHREIVPMVHALMDAHGDRGLKIGLPSTRVDSFSVEVADAVARGKKHTLTLAPEAGSQRLRKHDQQARHRGRPAQRRRARLQQRLDQHQDVLHGRPADRDRPRRGGDRPHRLGGEGDRQAAPRRARAGSRLQPRTSSPRRTPRTSGSRSATRRRCAAATASCARAAAAPACSSAGKTRRSRCSRPCSRAATAASPR